MHPTGQVSLTYRLPKHGGLHVHALSLRHPSIILSMYTCMQTYLHMISYTYPTTTYTYTYYVHMKQLEKYDHPEVARSWLALSDVTLTSRRDATCGVLSEK